MTVAESPKCFITANECIPSSMIYTNVGLDGFTIRLSLRYQPIISGRSARRGSASTRMVITRIGQLTQPVSFVTKNASNGIPDDCELSVALTEGVLPAS